MNLKNLKKNIKYHLFSINFRNNSFIIFEIKEKSGFFNSLILPPKKILTESFSKQIFAKSKSFKLKTIRFPNKVKLISLLSDFVYYLLMLKEKNYINIVYLVKMHFIVVSKNLIWFTNIFTKNKLFFVFYFLFPSLIKTKGFVQLIKSLNFPFIMVAL